MVQRNDSPWKPKKFDVAAFSEKTIRQLSKHVGLFDQSCLDPLVDFVGEIRKLLKTHELDDAFLKELWERYKILD